MCIQRGLDVGTDKSFAFIYNVKLADLLIIVPEYGSEVSYAYLPLMHPEILRLDVPVYVIALVDLSDAVDHLSRYVHQYPI